MASDRGNSTTGRTVALVGGSALVLWLLLRGKGWGLGGDGSGASAAGAGAAAANASPELPSGPRPSCKVFIRAQRIDLDGAPADLPAVVARCRASGRAGVQATGGASVQSVVDVVRALQAAGVVVAASDAIWDDLKHDAIWTAPKRAVAREP
jgi:hypothetical protein